MDCDDRAFAAGETRGSSKHIRRVSTPKRWFESWADRRGLGGVSGWPSVRTQRAGDACSTANVPLQLLGLEQLAASARGLEGAESGRANPSRSRVCGLE